MNIFLSYLSVLNKSALSLWNPWEAFHPSVFLLDLKSSELQLIYILDLGLRQHPSGNKMSLSDRSKGVLFQ